MQKLSVLPIEANNRTLFPVPLVVTSRNVDSLASYVFMGISLLQPLVLVLDYQISVYHSQ